MSLHRFSFIVLGESRDAVIEELDSHVRSIFERVDGEPWITITDDYDLIQIRPDYRDPGSFVYRGVREVVFGGPTILGDLMPKWEDGFRPQGRDDSHLDY